MKVRSLLLVVCCFVAVVPILAEDLSNVRSIEVTGRAEVRYAAEYVVIWAAVSSTGTSPQTIQTEVMTKVGKMLAYLQEKGLPKDDLGTSFVSLRNVSLENLYDEDCPTQPEVPSFEAYTEVRIVLRDLSLYDEVILALLERGLNEIRSISFESSLAAEKAREARILAIRAAKEKAMYLASELGQRIGHPINVEEIDTRSYFERDASYSNVVMITKSGSGGSSSSLLPRELKTSSEVTVVFKLHDLQETGA
jgi:uncharacterized protein YggE